MQEARLIVPKADNDGADLGAVHDELQRRLCDDFGGFTASDARGGWVGHNGAVYREPVTVYDVALDNGGLGKLADVAQWAREAARQQSVYLRFPSGEVVFVQ